jgi:hypothetical protein
MKKPKRLNILNDLLRKKNEGAHYLALELASYSIRNDNIEANGSCCQ